MKIFQHHLSPTAGYEHTKSARELECVVRLRAPDFLADPYGVYRRLRQEAPVWWCESASAWLVTTYEDVRFVLTNPRSFSSEPNESHRPPYDDPDSGMIIISDPPAHDRARRMFTGSGGYTADSVESHRQQIAEICTSIVHQLPYGEFDAVTDVALPAAVGLFEWFFDLPTPDSTEPSWKSVLLDYYSPGTGSATKGLIEYLQRVVQMRRHDPGEDPVSHAVVANARLGLMSDEQLAWNFFDAILAGAASTVAVASESIGAIASQPDRQRSEYWETDDAAYRSADELLRWTNHIQLVIRRAIHDIEMQGKLIRSGDDVYAILASANRDELTWPRGEELDLTRGSGQPCLAFGYGPHIATGMMLARTFLATLLPTLIAARGPFRRGGPAEHSYTRGISTPRVIPITKALQST